MNGKLKTSFNEDARAGGRNARADEGREIRARAPIRGSPEDVADATRHVKPRAQPAGERGASRTQARNVTNARGTRQRQPTKTPAQRADTTLPKPEPPCEGATNGSGDAEKGRGPPDARGARAGTRATDRPPPCGGTSEARPKAALKHLRRAEARKVTTVPRWSMRGHARHDRMAFIFRGFLRAHYALFLCASRQKRMSL